MVSPIWEQIWTNRIETVIDTEILHGVFNGNIKNYLQETLPENTRIKNAKASLIKNLEKGNRVEDYDQLKSIGELSLTEIDTGNWNDGLPIELANRFIEEDNNKFEEDSDKLVNVSDVQGLADLKTETEEQQERQQVFLFNTINPEITKAKNAKDVDKLNELRGVARNLTDAGDRNTVFDRIDKELDKL